MSELSNFTKFCIGTTIMVLTGIKEYMVSIIKYQYYKNKYAFKN